MVDGDEEPTVIRLTPQDAETRPELPAVPQSQGPLSATRVAVMRDPHTQRPTLMVLPQGAVPPPGCAVAMLVASSSRDTELLAQLLERSVL
jgi:hypothetical protein